MPNDHSVARTYLKRWCDRDKNQPMQAYRKPNGAPFPCWPESVCAETGGDLNPDYFKDPAVLGQFRAIFEPRWDAAIDAVEKRKLTFDDPQKLSKKYYGTSHVLSMDEAKFIFERGCEQLILGSGQMGNVHLSPEAAGYFAKKGCKVRLQPTPEAIRVFNGSHAKKIGLFT